MGSRVSHSGGTRRSRGGMVSPTQRPVTGRELPVREHHGSYEWIVAELKRIVDGEKRVVADWDGLFKRRFDVRFREACAEAYAAGGLMAAAYFLCDQLGCVPFVEDDVSIRRACVTAYLLGGKEAANEFLAQLAKGRDE